MIWPADYHLHTPLCRHATGQPIELAARAAELGFREIGFSDHNPMPRDDFDDWRMRDSQLEEYVGLVTAARRAQPQLNIKLALEVDYLPEAEDWIRDLAARYPWDYLIGSVHYLWGGWAIDNPRQMSSWKDHEPLEIWTLYFERLAMAAQSGLFDIIGHADLCKKFCFYPKEDCAPLYARFLEAAARAGVAMELNTAGLRKDCREIYPCRRLVQMAAEARVPITFGSDAHAPEEVGLDFARAVQAALDAGHTHYCRFTGRRRQMTRIDGPGGRG
ncbi:MAG: histidinol-phosphatase HisJ family protein [Limisphaerales bacterium]